LTGLAEQAGLTLEFPTGEPIRLSGFRDGDSPFFEFDPNQPDSNLILNILQKVGLVPMRETPVHLPWFIDRPYENERVGEIAHKSRRAIRQKYNLEMRARLWAMCAFFQIASYPEMNDFLERNPKYWLLIPIIVYAMLKTLFVKILSMPFEILAG
jgi:hypothetical protein